MIIKLRHLVIVETLLIFILLGAFSAYYLIDKHAEQKSSEGLLSPRIYTGVLQPKSFLIMHFKPLKQKITDYIVKNNINASVYVENLRNGAFMGINERNEFVPASLNKLPVAILIMKNIENENLSLDTKLQIRDSDRASGYGDLYKTPEKELPLKLVLEKLMKESDNTALRMLLHYVDLEDLQFVFDYYGMDLTILNDGSKHTDLVSPKELSGLFSSLYFSTVLEPENSEYILSLMEDSEVDIKKMAAIPDDVRLAHKFGANYYQNNQFFHDCGIMYIDDSRILYCIMTKGSDQEKSSRAIATIVHDIYEYVISAKSKISDYTSQN